MNRRQVLAEGLRGLSLPAAPALVNVWTAEPAGAAGLQLHPRDFGAVGDGETDDSAALNKCMLAAREKSANGPVEVIIDRRHAVAASVTLSGPKGPVAVRGVGTEAGLRAIGQATVTSLAIKGAPGWPEVGASIARNAGRGESRLILAAPIAAAAGDFLQIWNETGFTTDRRQTLLQIARIEGPSVTLASPLPFPIDTRHAAEVRISPVASTVTIEGLTFDGRANSGDSRGLHIASLLSPRVSRVLTIGFDRRYSAGQIYDSCHKGEFSDLSDDGSGSNAIRFQNLAGASIQRIGARGAKGVGISLNFMSGCELSALSTDRPAGRAIKLSGVCGNQFSDVAIRDGGYTGLSISSGSSYNIFRRTVCIGNKQSGCWLNGTGNNNNRFIDITSRANNPDLVVWATPPLVDLDNRFSNVHGGFAKMAVRPETRTVIE